ncbi:MAG: xanthine dehydrogenase family protein subunit M [Candidatus Symbiobacter sp.]|nr:xanthine dehydrogenase family protein subunit M [Candidatus Symbiobacter sp.]
MYRFDYVRPKSVDEAGKFLAAQAKNGAKILGGGQSLLPTMKQRLAQPSALVAVAGLADLNYVRVAGNKVTIGGATLHDTVARDAQLQKLVPGLTHLAAHIGDPAVRNRGTFGGSVANNDPAACYPSAVLAIGGEIITNKRRIAVDQFFKGLFATALAEDEILTGWEFTAPKKSGYGKFLQPASRFAIIGAFVAQTDAGVRVAITGGGNGVFRAKPLEDALAKSFSAAAVEGVKVDMSHFNGDLHASAEYRAHLATVMTGRAVASCHGG